MEEKQVESKTFSCTNPPRFVLVTGVFLIFGYIPLLGYTPKEILIALVLLSLLYLFVSLSEVLQQMAHFIDLIESSLGVVIFSFVIFNFYLLSVPVLSLGIVFSHLLLLLYLFRFYRHIHRVVTFLA